MGNLFETAVKKVSRSKISVVGIAIVSVLLPVLLILMLLDLQGLISAPYFVFLINLVIWPLCGIGFLLIFVGLFFSSKEKEDIGLYALEYIQEQFSRPGRFVRVRKLIYLAIGSTLLTLFILIIAFSKGFQYTESVAFCGLFCHSVMEPEFVTYQNSPHSSVRCVQCHLAGEGQNMLKRSKLSGVRQLYATATGSYSRPIQTPLSSLRPENENCNSCHRPEKFYGDRLYVRDRYLPDQDNTPVRTVMLMRVGSGGYQGHQARGIHWHISEDFEVFYQHSDPAREEITRVILTRPDGSREIFNGPEYAGGHAEPLAPGDQPESRGFKKMDCIDCHNRPAHVFQLPEEALDQKLLTDIIPRSLPFIKRQALEAITVESETTEIALRRISQSLQSWYRENYPEMTANDKALLDQAIRGAQLAYRENVFPGMNIGWGTYRSFLSHADDSGCFRCHGRLREEKSGRLIVADCQACHIILAENQRDLDNAAALQKRLEQLQ
jgi:hypothetical protein